MGLGPVLAAAAVRVLLHWGTGLASAATHAAAKALALWRCSKFHGLFGNIRQSMLVLCSLRGSLSAMQGMPSFGAAGGGAGGGGQGGGQLAFLRQNQQFQVRCTASFPCFLLLDPQLVTFRYRYFRSEAVHCRAASLCLVMTLEGLLQPGHTIRLQQHLNGHHEQIRHNSSGWWLAWSSLQRSNCKTFIESLHSRSESMSRFPIVVPQNPGCQTAEAASY